MPGTKKAEVKKINTVPALLGADSLLEKTIKKKKNTTQLIIVSTTVIRPQSKTAAVCEQAKGGPNVLEKLAYARLP